jgi:hypothetical protein
MNNINLRLADILGTITATICITVSLAELIPNGMWLYLGGLVFGVVVLTNKINAIIRKGN